MKYAIGTVLKNTPKAVRRHPNKFSPQDRYRVTGDKSADWFKSEDWTDPYSGRKYNAGEVIDSNVRVVHDSYVTTA